MKQFDSQTVVAMRAALDEVCRHIPANSNSARTFVASRILECASNGEQTYDALMLAGRRAVLDRFADVESVRAMLMK